MRRDFEIIGIAIVRTVYFGVNMKGKGDFIVDYKNEFASNEKVESNQIF